MQESPTGGGARVEGGQSSWGGPGDSTIVGGAEEIRWVVEQESVNREEVKKFGALANEWWDAAGPFAPLHAMNPVRSAFIRDTLCSCYGCAVAAF